MSTLTKKATTLWKYLAVMSERNETIYRVIRNCKGWSVEKVAREALMSPETVRRIEKGKDPSKDQVVMLDKVYGCDEELIDFWLGRIKFSRGVTVCGREGVNHSFVVRYAAKSYVLAIFLCHWIRNHMLAAITYLTRLRRGGITALSQLKGKNKRHLLAQVPSESGR